MSITDPTTTPEEPEGVRNLREALEREKAKSAKGEEAERKLAMLEAGVDIKHPVGAMFAKSYDGEMTEEAIAAAYAELGVTSTAPPVLPETSEPTPPSESAQRRQLASEALPPAALNNEDPEPTLNDAFVERQRLLSEGATQKEASVPVFGHMFTQAASGNPDFVWDAAAEQRHKELAAQQEE